MVRLIPFFALLLFVMPASAEIAGEGRAIAGDALVIDQTLVRLNAIDAPEFDQTCQRGEASWPCGVEATAALTALVEQGGIVCHDEQSVGSDTVEARCEVAGKDLALAILAAGLAVNRAIDNEGYAQAESSARDARRGLWSGDFMDPEKWRKVMSCSCSARKKAFARNAKLLKNSQATAQ
ncbi:MAG: thermonuclease family protein [Alphaproteobacteria bacterium]|nr:thermonuclease family protein [Alphaproteobacteria bacterium]